MKKIRLNLDHVEVESFLTSSAQQPRPQEKGTVVANISSRPGATYCGCTVFVCTEDDLC